jgi:AraC-like DNA-binding protein
VTPTKSCVATPSTRDTISIHLVREAVQNSHVHLDRILPLAGLDRRVMDDDQARVSVHTYATLWRHLSKALDDEFFGMDARPLRRGSFAFLCQACMQQPTVGAALKVALKFLSLMLADYDGRLATQQSMAEIVIHERTAEPKRAFACFTYWMIVHGIACWLAGRRIPILAMELRGPRPQYIDDYQVMFSRNLRFDRPRTRLIFAAEHLDLPVRRSTAELKRFLARAPANILVRYRDPASLGWRIRQRLRNLPAGDFPSIEAMAAYCGASVATLRRRLAEEGAGYQALKDSVRKERAVLWLAEPYATFEDIAERLGFADTSSFYKAFRKWTGASPGHYRSLILDAGDLREQ